MSPCPFAGSQNTKLKGGEKKKKRTFFPSFSQVFWSPAGGRAVGGSMGDTPTSALLLDAPYGRARRPHRSFRRRSRPAGGRLTAGTGNKPRPRDFQVKNTLPRLNQLGVYFNFQPRGRSAEFGYGPAIGSCTSLLPPYVLKPRSRRFNCK